ncbi:hypothetical protein D3C87_1510600 [compost metagenome]
MQHRTGVEPTRTAAASGFRDQRTGQAIVDDHLPQRVGTVAVIEAFEQFTGDLSGEQTLDAVGDHALHFGRDAVVGILLIHCCIHRRPRPPAIMPRRISRVPPRSEKDGAL